MTTSATQAKETRYALTPGLVRVTVGSAYVVEGGTTRVPFTGPGAVDVLPGLCDLLDGTRSLPELALALDIPVEDVRDGVALLRNHGLVETVDPTAPADGAPGEPSAFFARSAGYADRARSAAEAAARLAAARVLVAGDGPLAAAVRSELARAVPAVHGFSAELLDALPDSDGVALPMALVVQVFEGAGERTPDVLERCFERQVPWLGAAAGRDGGFAGPMVHGAYACAACAWSALPLPPAAPGADLPAGPAALLTGLVVAEAVHALSGVAAVGTVNRLLRVGWDENRRPAAEVDEPRLYRSADCARCGSAALAGAAEAQQVWEFEQEIELPPPQFGIPASFKRKPDTTELQRAGRTLPTGPVLRAADLPAGAPEVSEVFALLRRTVGVRERSESGVPFRVIPSGGNLGSQQAFVVSRTELPGLGSHAAWYDPARDALVATGRVTAAEVAHTLAPVLGDERWDRLLVWVADVGKLSAKYGDFGFRLGFLDAGVALSQTFAAAGAMGLRPRLLARWESAGFTGLLDLNPETEPVTGVVILQGEA
ncbi:hypothetical protein ACFVT9_12485 [Kitasatospora cineracea]|uniref:hypothetical protein n=1 Tax=Kitasatospora cineracea TaxID=88074 RepID=UPI0036DEF1F2